jgi:hypothetical protein
VPLTDRQAETETIIRIGYAKDGTREVSFYSTEQRDWSLAEAAEWELVQSDQYGREYRAPLALFRFRMLNSAQRERDRQARSERARKQGAKPPRPGHSALA